MAYNRFNPYAFALGQADRNHDGVLDRNEFRNFRDFQNADRNHDGRVGLVEFANIAAPNLNINPRNTAQAFMIADQNHDGFLDQRELSDFSDFQHADLNHDGRIDPIEMRLFNNNSFNGNYQPNYPPPPPPRRHHHHHHQCRQQPLNYNRPMYPPRPY
ncbi:unnamed protein product [Adineta steineri]|uniref:EF-hand domain-containing protein n=1 Tax=Adineta steineri TaxID=433720 RepID=A0A818M6G4_9BILA|nr:unnamed protein product [Adineta steineri]CAF3583079.1 unnamed protein product [Adineta steineri]